MNAPSPQGASIRDQAVAALQQIEDPELFLDIWFLGLIYRVDVVDQNVEVDMTFTSPMCPAGPMLIDQVKDKIGEIEGVEEVEVKVVFDPPWEPSDEVKGMLGIL